MTIPGNPFQTAGPQFQAAWFLYKYLYRLVAKKVAIIATTCNMEYIHSNRERRENMLTEKAVPLCVLQVLSEYSDEKHSCNR